MSTAYNILGVVSPSALAVAKVDELDMPIAAVLVPGVGGGLAGLALWREHRVLGFLAGDSLGMNAYRLYRGDPGDRALALCNLGAAGAGIAGSLMTPKHPFWGWVGGFLLGSAVTALVPGSNARKLVKK